MKKILIVSTICLTICVNIFSQNDVKPVDGNNPGAVYYQLLAKLKSGDTGIDYKALRVAFTDTREFASFKGETDQKMLDALGAQKYREAIKIAEEALKVSYIDIDAHFVCATGYIMIKDRAKAAFHLKVYSGLMGSILIGAGGKSPDTAFQVLSEAEENVVIRALMVVNNDQTLVDLDGHKFDLIGVTDVKTAERKKIYFNIDLLSKRGGNQPGNEN